MEEEDEDVREKKKLLRAAKPTTLIKMSFSTKMESKKRKKNEQLCF